MNPQLNSTECRCGLFSTMIAAALLAAQFLTAGVARASPSPSPSPSSAAPSAAHSEAEAHIPSDFDPCGGSLELLNKIGNGTACVFVRGEAAITAQYVSANIPSNAQVNFGGPSRNQTFDFSSAAQVLGYPASVIYIGVAPRAQISITPPSFVQVNSNALAKRTGNGVLTAGASNMQFAYKQLLYVDLTHFTMFALNLAYTAPTGSPMLRGAGPSYTIDPIVTQPLPHNLGITLAFPTTNSNFTNATTCSRTATGILCVPGATQRGWNFAPQLVPYWTSPGGTLLGIFVQHNFNPSSTPIAISAAQLFSRHFDLAMSYGGFNYSASSTGPVFGLVKTSATAYPTLFSVSLNYLIGHSDLPEALQQ